MSGAMYKLIKNHLFRDEERYNGRVVYTETLHMKDLMELMMYHGSTVTRADIIRHVILNGAKRSEESL